MDIDNNYALHVHIFWERNFAKHLVQTIIHIENRVFHTDVCLFFISSDYVHYHLTGHNDREHCLPDVSGHPLPTS